MTELLSERLTLNDINQAPHFDVPDVYLLDYDRTLGLVGKAMQRVKAVGERYGIGGHVIDHGRSLVEDNGGAFAPFALVRGQLDPESYNNYCKDFMDDPESLLYDDGSQLLRALGSEPITPHLVVTSSVEPAGQAIKIGGSGYTGHAEYIRLEPDETGAPQTRPKGPVIEEWIGSGGTIDLAAMDGGNLLAVLHAQTGTLIDDSRKALRGLPRQVRGVLLERPEEPAGETSKPPKGHIPEGVITIGGLAEIIPHIDKTPTPGLDLPYTTHFVPVLTAIGRNI